MDDGHPVPRRLDSPTYCMRIACIIASCLIFNALFFNDSFAALRRSTEIPIVLWNGASTLTET